MGEIAFDNVSKAWSAGTDREVLAIDGVSFAVQDGEFVVIIGPSGCGKSTMLQMASGLETPTSGTITSGPIEKVLGHKGESAAGVLKVTIGRTGPCTDFRESAEPGVDRKYATRDDDSHR